MSIYFAIYHVPNNSYTMLYTYQDICFQHWSTCHLTRSLFRPFLHPRLLLPPPHFPLPTTSLVRRRTLLRQFVWPSWWMDAEMCWCCTIRGNFMQWICTAIVSSLNVVFLIVKSILFILSLFFYVLKYVNNHVIFFEVWDFVESLTMFITLTKQNTGLYNDFTFTSFPTTDSGGALLYGDIEVNGLLLSLNLVI